MESSQVRSKGAKVGAVVAGVLAALFGLWHFVGLILASDRGLDITDEGLYLLAADPPSATAAWGFPFGWHTRPLFQIVGYDIAAFRTLGGVLLVLASGFFGWAATTAVLRLQLQSRFSRKQRITLQWAGTVISGFGSLLYYAALLRSPSYNWVNLFGISLAGAGLMMLLLNMGRDGAVRHRLTRLAWALLSSFGMFITIPAKPSTPVFLGVLAVVVVALLFGWGRAWRWGLVLFSGIVGWLLVALALRVWPIEFLDVFARALNIPTLLPSASVGGAIRNALLSPQTAASTIANAPPLAIVAVIFGFLLLALSVLERKLWLAVRIIGFALVAVGSLMLAAVPLPLGGLPSQVFRWIHVPTTTACILMLVAAGLVRTQLPVDPKVLRTQVVSRTWLIGLYIATLPFIFGFGSGHGTYRQTSLAAGFFILAAFISLLTARNRVLLTFTTLILLLFQSALVATTLSQSYQVPYRIPSMERQLVPTIVGNHGSQLLLDEDLHGIITAYRSQAESAGWVSGTPLVGFSWRWDSGLPYILGARPPETLMLTLWGYPGSQSVLNYNLKVNGDVFPVSDSWIVTSAMPEGDEEAKEAISSGLNSWSALAGRAFPVKYECVARVAGWSLWKPGETGVPAADLAGSSCTIESDQLSNYDSNGGWSPGHD